MRLPLALCLLLVAGCTERRFAGPPPVESAVAPPLVAGGDGAGALVLPPGAAPGVTDGPAPSWVEAVRLERWTEAAALIDALPEPTRERPALRYVRARAAVGTGDAARALTLLDGLEPSLPLLVADIARWRAEAQLVAGPFAPAAAYFARSHTAHDLTRAADAYQKAGDLPAARATADRAVAAHGKTSRDEVAARTRRADSARARGGDDAAEPDLRWVATHAAGTAEGRAAAEALDRRKRPLSPHERVLALDGLDPAGAGAAATAPVIEQVTGHEGDRRDPEPPGADPPGVPQGPGLGRREGLRPRGQGRTRRARSRRGAARAGHGPLPGA